MKSVIFPLTTVVVLSSSCASNYLDYQGTKLRKTSASRSQLLWAGDKIKQGPNTFAPFGKLKFETLPASVTTALSVDKTDKWATEVKASGLESVSIVGADGKSTGQRTDKGVFTIVDIQGKSALLDIINSEENRPIVTRLIKTHIPRVVTTVATTEAQETVRADRLNSSVSANLVALGTPGEIGIKFSKEGKSSVKFSDGTVFAFSMSIPAWQWDSSAQRLVVGDLVEDIPGVLDPTPVRGTHTDIRKVPGIPEVIVQQVLAGTYR